MSFLKRYVSIFSLIKPEKYSGKRRGACTSEISTIDSENQVKTYMDSSNGVRNASSNAYNKVRASASSPTFFFQKYNCFLFLFNLSFSPTPRQSKTQNQKFLPLMLRTRFAVDAWWALSNKSRGKIIHFSLFLLRTKTIKSIPDFF